MKTTIHAISATLAAACLAGAASAATVTATFSGAIQNAGDTGGLGLAAGTDVTVEIVGEDDAPNLGQGLPSGISGTFDSLSSYDLTSFSTMLGGLNLSAIAPQIFVFDNFVPTGETSAVDGVYAVGAVGGTGSMEYLVTFDPTTFSGSALQTAVGLGLARATALAESVAFEDGNAFFRAPVAATNILVEDTTPTDPGTGGGTGGGTPSPTPVPLPASGLLLLAGLAGIGAARRKR